APDFPFVIFVVACGDCLQIPAGASTARSPPARPAPGYRFREMWRCWNSWAWERFALPAKNGRAGGRFLHTWWLAS
ncbi:hypothetical protein ACOTFB_15755, partial [Achromobacter xylosoxidans]